MPDCPVQLSAGKQRLNTGMNRSASTEDPTFTKHPSRLCISPASLNLAAKFCMPFMHLAAIKTTIQCTLRCTSAHRSTASGDNRDRAPESGKKSRTALNLSMLLNGSATMVTLSRFLLPTLSGLSESRGLLPRGRFCSSLAEPPPHTCLFGRRQLGEVRGHPPC